MSTLEKKEEQDEYENADKVGDGDVDGHEDDAVTIMSFSL